MSAKYEKILSMGSFNNDLFKNNPGNIAEIKVTYKNLTGWKKGSHWYTIRYSPVK